MKTTALLAATLIGTCAAISVFAQPATAPAPAQPSTDRQAEKPAQTGRPAPKPGPKAAWVLDRPVEAMLAERIAKELIAASPIAPAGDAKARDRAADRLSQCKELMECAGARILWGGFNPAQGYDPDNYRLDTLSPFDYFQLTEFVPVVWAKLYLSTFMFPGPYTIHKEGRFTVLELDAQFRDGLDPGEYPYPFWHSPNKWTAYVNVQKVMFIFEPGRLIAAMRRSPDPIAIKQIRRPWDTKWLWTDADGNPQPRVALFTYLFSKDNPHVSELDRSYRALEKNFREQDCMMCHEPDNRGRINDLLLLNYPNQALIMRRTLLTILEDNSMPPGDPLTQTAAGVANHRVLDEMKKLAREFERAADAALAFEKTRPATTPPSPAPIPAQK